MNLEVYKVLDGFRRSGQFCDAKIIVEDRAEFLVHKNIISAYSDYFRVLFTTKLSRNVVSVDQYFTTTLNWIPADIMDVIINYVYTGCLVLNQDTVNDVYISVDYLGMEKAIEMCANFLVNQLNYENCFEISDFGAVCFYLPRNKFTWREITVLHSTYMNNFIMRESQQYIMLNFSVVSEKNQNILNVSFDRMLEFLSSDNLYVRDEEEIWKLVVRWVNADENRKGFLSSLMGEIRLGLINHDYLETSIKKNTLLIREHDCERIILQVEKFYSLRNYEKEQPKLFRPRISRCVLFAIGGWNDIQCSRVVEAYDSRADRWLYLNSITGIMPKAYHGTVYLDDKIYMIGGFDGDRYCNSCRCYDINTNTWTNLSCMNHSRGYVSVAVFDGFIYAFGGFGGGDVRFQSVERFDPSTNNWTTVQPMRERRSDAGVAILNNKIYIIGGYDGNECLDTVEIYNPRLDTWSRLPSMTTRRSGLSCVAYYGCVYALGGFDGIIRLNSVEKFDPESNTWTNMWSLFTARSNFSAEIVDDAIIVMGGFDGVSTIAHVEEFDIRFGKWKLSTDMNVRRSGFSSCVVSNLSIENLKQYLYKNRNNLLMEKKQKMIDFENSM